MGIKYSSDLKERAKEQAAHLVTIDITGTLAKAAGATGQVCITSPEEVEKCWEFFNWLVVGRRKKDDGKPAKHSPPP